MKTLIKGILPTAAIALALASPAAAQKGEEVVPPENSAVNQYTEGFPTAGGEKDAHDQRDKRKPDKVLGERNTERLEQRGSAGRAVAELTAETAPVTAAPETGGESVVEEGTTAVGRGKGDGDRDGPTAVQKSGLDSAQPVALAFDPAEVDGSSGTGSVIGQAFGSSSGLGLLLPLLLLATIAWAIGYAMRQKRVAG